MPMATWVMPVLPDEEMSVDCEPRIIESKFGDGYSQEAGDGINNLQREMNPRWTNLRKAEADAIIAFLEPRAKTREPFWWTPNGESAARALKVLKFSYAWKKGRFCNINAMFKETAARA
jgi:phage-related protein